MSEATAAGDRIDNRVSLLILQHPQEQDHALGSAPLLVANLADVTFRVGLSWASLAKALGRPADPKRWGILHLGSTRATDLPKGREIVVLDRKGAPAREQESVLAELEGIVIFDGTWSQAKTLWWRNPWVLKARRLALNPQKPSLYGRLRREPRREGLSTLEAAALVLSRLENRPEIESRLTDAFAAMLKEHTQSTANPRT